MELSICAVVIDSLSQTQRFVSSIRDYTNGKYELILIDNQSKDAKTRKYLKENADEYYRFSKRASLSEAWNKGISLAKGKYIVISNNDVVVPPNWFYYLKKDMDAIKGIGMVSPLTQGIFQYNYGRGRMKIFDRPFKIERWRQGVWGEFMAFPASVLKGIGGFDESYKIASGEDLEMLYRLHEKNLGVYIEPRVFLHHDGSVTANNILGKKERNRIWNNNWKKFLRKWSKYKDYILDRK